MIFMKPQLPEGYIAKYTHVRQFEKIGGQVYMDPRGGMTRCRILDEEGNEVVTSVARCSDEDNYCKSTGRNISLGRAIKQLQKRETIPA
jgi:hypothetical protein